MRHVTNERGLLREPGVCFSAELGPGRELRQELLQQMPPVPEPVNSPSALSV